MKKHLFTSLLTLLSLIAHAQPVPQETTRPWVYYHMLYGAISKEGFAADFEAMKAAGIGGAYLFSIRNTDRMPGNMPPVEISPALSESWWDKIGYAVRKADSLDFQLGFHICDGFALAGGPWITPELSMQKIVWADTVVDGGGGRIALPVPAHYQDYYVDVAAYAYPLADASALESTRTRAVKLTTDAAGENADPSVLIVPGNKRRFSSGGEFWIQYAFDAPFTVRSIEMVYGLWQSQAYKWTLSTSDDGVNFRPAAVLDHPRFGWQNGEAPTTFAVPETTARYFRLAWKWADVEPGAEDIDAAKFGNGPSLLEIQLSGEPKVNQFEGKSAAVWRVGASTTEEQLPDNICVDPAQLIRINLDEQGRADLSELPAGRWRVLRMGHTSTGKTNETAGAAGGLECDKFNPEAVQLQFDNWFGMIYHRVGADVARRTIRGVQVDSWECGSQNWTAAFPEEFKRRRGYDLMPCLPLYAGVPIGSAEQSEKVLLDIRETVAELIVDVFHEVMRANAHAYGCHFNTETVAPTQTSDGLMHFRTVDSPMGEFWFRSPTHDKPSDILDAVHGAHIYGKNVVSAEAFTQLRIQWDEHPGGMKRLADLNYALGVNRMVYHVYVHNPWPDLTPGLTLDGIGWYFQRGQTWWPHVRGWTDYARRVQEQLQRGRPVADVAVFTGEDIPRRSVLPDRLVSSLPGIFGAERVERERVRLLNEGHPKHTVYTVSSAKNFTPIGDWIDPLKGYTYDSFNKDVLLQAKAAGGRMVLPGGASYRVVVVPLPDRMTMNDARFRSPEVAAKLAELRAAGVVVLEDGKGLPYTDESFEPYGLARDLTAVENGAPAAELAWIHRRDGVSEIYFLSNQLERERTLALSLRGTGKSVKLYDPVTGESRVVPSATVNGRTELSLTLPPQGSIFVEIDPKAAAPDPIGQNPVKQTIATPWRVTFKGQESQTWPTPTDWTTNENPEIKYYSGLAVYETEVEWHGKKGGKTYLDLGKVGVMAEVFVNGKSCGIAWTPPYRVEITGALKKGRNTLLIEVTNVWANRLNGIRAGAVSGEGVYHSSPHRFGEGPVPSGLLGPVMIVTE